MFPDSTFRVPRPSTTARTSSTLSTRDSSPTPWPRRHDTPSTARSPNPRRSGRLGSGTAAAAVSRPVSDPRARRLLCAPQPLPAYPMQGYVPMPYNSTFGGGSVMGRAPYTGGGRGGSGNGGSVSRSGFGAGTGGGEGGGCGGSSRRGPGAGTHPAAAAMGLTPDPRRGFSATSAGGMARGGESGGSSKLSGLEAARVHMAGIIHALYSICIHTIVCTLNHVSRIRSVSVSRILCTQKERSSVPCKKCTRHA